MVKEPKTLQEAIKYFADYQNCHDYLLARRWQDGKVTCPKCGSENVHYYEKYRRFQCREGHEAPQFTLKTGSIMEESPIAVEKWLLAIWQAVNCKNGISSYELHRAIGVTQKSAWFMLQRIRKAMQQDGPQVRLGGPGTEVEVDETFIGGKARNMHKEKRDRMVTGRGGLDKTCVMGLLERGGKIRLRTVKNTRINQVQREVRLNVVFGSTVYSDALPSYRGLADSYEHQFVDHADRYVNGRVHTNGLENFWSLLKRSIAGTYVSVEPFHLFRYLDEQAFRYNNRKDAEGKPLTDSDRFSIAVSQLAGKRLTFAEVTGKLQDATLS